VTVEWLRKKGKLHLGPDVGHFHTHELSFHGHVKGKLYGRVKTYGGDLLQSCLAENTRVWTLQGVKNIYEVTPDDKVWDGAEFVRCGGAIHKGERDVIEKFGVKATPDHKFLIGGNWVEWEGIHPEESARTSFEPVYDILNCGPRNRFAVISDTGLLIAHNCTQGTGMDLLLHGCVAAERQGFEPFFVVHDQALASAKGGLDKFIAALCTRPPWFKDFPLEADGSVVASYCKD